MAKRRKIKEKMKKLLEDEKDIEFNKAEFSAKQWIEERKAEKQDENDNS